MIALNAVSLSIVLTIYVAIVGLSDRLARTLEEDSYRKQDSSKTDLKGKQLFDE
jgi:hypothetical protein